MILYYEVDQSHERHELQLPHYWATLDDGWIEIFAVECAEDYEANHDGLEGWEEGVARTFALFDVDGKPLGTCSVEMEMAPRYSAEVVKPKQNNLDSAGDSL